MAGKQPMTTNQPVSPIQSKIEKVFVNMDTNEDSKSLATFVHWPPHLKPATSFPTSTDPRRVVCLVLHPHPKMGGNAHNNVVDFLCNILTNGSYLSYVEKNNDSGHDDDGGGDDGDCDDDSLRRKRTLSSGFPSLYDVSHYGPKTQRDDLSYDPKNNRYHSRLLGPLQQQVLPNVYDVIGAGPGVSHPQVLDQTGIITVRFHTSGIEDSDGSSSWTGTTSAEVEDVVTILRWLFHPQSKIFPTDLFLVGYSFGAAILSSALNRILLSNTTDQSTIQGTYYGTQTRASYQSLSKHLYNSLRGTVFLSYPCGFFARTLLGIHISRLRSLSTYLMQDKQKEEETPPPTSKQPPRSQQSPRQEESPPLSQPKHYMNHTNTPTEIPPMMYFVMDQDDEITGPQTLVDMLQSLPFPTNVYQKRSMFQLLRTHTGHSYRGAEHILALLLSSYFCNSIGYHNSVVRGQVQQAVIDTTTTTTSPASTCDSSPSDGTRSRTSGRDKTQKTTSTQPPNPQPDDKKTKSNPNTTSQPETKALTPLPPVPTTHTHNPSMVLHTAVYRDEFFRVYFKDMNLWIVVLIIFLIVCRIVYARYFEQYVRHELGLAPVVKVATDFVEAAGTGENTEVVNEVLRSIGE